MSSKPVPATRHGEIYIGLMSGTSLDGVDAAIIDFSEFPPRLLYSSTTPYPTQLHTQIRELCHSQTTSLDSLYRLDAELGEVYADVVNGSLAQAGIPANQIVALGCHGQTIRHSPDSEIPYTAQIGDPNRIAARTGITTVADFRRKDIAWGGQAAPLAPAFHRFLFHSKTENRVVVNIGGIANITWLPADQSAPILGFDTGPGNTLLDYWIQRQQNKAYDAGGSWATSGRLNPELLRRMLEDEPYFSLAAPKSTGTEYFNPDWLLKFVDDTLDPADVQATLAELTARSIAGAIRGLPSLPGSCYLCGGGAHNQLLHELLAQALPECKITTTETLGLSPDFVEASAFAWLARERINQRPTDLQDVTRASRSGILGAIIAAENFSEN